MRLNRICLTLFLSLQAHTSPEKLVFLVDSVTVFLFSHFHLCVKYLKQLCFWILRIQITESFVITTNLGTKKIGFQKTPSKNRIYWTVLQEVLQCHYCTMSCWERIQKSFYITDYTSVSIKKVTESLLRQLLPLSTTSFIKCGSDSR